MPGKVSKSGAKYGDSPRAGERCGNCVMLRLRSDGKYMCTKVEGEVKKNKWCKFFYPKGKK